MALQHLFRFVETHDHERGGIGIGHSTTLGNDRCREDAMLNGIARLGVNRVGKLLTALIIEVTIVATGSHRLISQIQDGLQLMTRIQLIVGRFCDTNLPGESFWIDTTRHHFSANLDHVILYTTTLQQTGHTIRTIALGNG